MPIPDDDVSGVPAEKAPRKGAVVTEARRLLMRLATQMNSHPLDLSRLEPRAAVASSPVDLTSLARPGAREPDAAPLAPRTRAAALPRVAGIDAEAGIGHLTPYCSVSADQSRLTDDFSVFVRNAPMTIPAPTLAPPAGVSLSVDSFGLDVHLAGGGTADLAPTKLLEKPSIFGLTTAPPTFSKPAKPGFRAWSFPVPRVRPVPARVAEAVPLERRRIVLPAPESPAGRNVHLLTRRMLAKAAGEGVQEEDISIVGIYRRVPIGAAAKMAFDDATGMLCLTLRPDAARVVQSQGPHVVSIVFGRVRSDGRLVRALMPAPSSTGR